MPPWKRPLPLDDSAKFSALHVIVMLIQGVLLAIATFGDFGFYFPGSWGDWHHWVFAVLAYVLSFVIGVALAVACGCRRFALMECALPLALWGGITLYDAIPEPIHRAADYQHLLGKTESEVEAILRRRWRQTVLSGNEGDANGQRDFLSVRGMRVYFELNCNGLECRAVEVVDQQPWQWVRAQVSWNWIARVPDALACLMRLPGCIVDAC